jgi:hypothetical protein
MVHVTNSARQALHVAVKWGCVIKLPREICGQVEILDIHHTRLLHTMLLIGINVLSLGRIPIWAPTIHHFIKGSCVHYDCVINNYDAWSTGPPIGQQTDSDCPAESYFTTHLFQMCVPYAHRWAVICA